MKKFEKAWDKEGPAISHLAKFCKISEAKLTKGISVGPQTRELLKDEAFDATLSQLFPQRVSYWTTVRIRVAECHELHLLHSHLDFFPEQGERLH
jgi:hypothetical protein